MTSFDCPRCGTMLTMSERQGVEIDYCQQCRGIWLDRGELDKILDRVGGELAAAQGSAQPVGQPGAQAAGGSAGGWTQPAAAPGWPAGAAPTPAVPPYYPDQHAAWDPRQQRWRDDDDDDKHRYRTGKRRKHWLAEMFD